MAVSIGFALQAPALVLFSLITVGRRPTPWAALAARWRCWW